MLRTDQNGNTRLHLSIMTSKKEEALSLIDSFPNALRVKNKTTDWTPLFFAIANFKPGMYPVIKKIIDKDPLTLTDADFMGNTPLHLAITIKNKDPMDKDLKLKLVQDIVKKIDECKLQHVLNATSAKGGEIDGNVLHVAAFFGDLEIVKLLAPKMKEHLSAKNSKKLTAQEIASGNKHEPTVDYLKKLEGLLRIQAELEQKKAAESKILVATHRPLREESDEESKRNFFGDSLSDELKEFRATIDEELNMHFSVWLQSKEQKAEEVLLRILPALIFSNDVDRVRKILTKVGIDKRCFGWTALHYAVTLGRPDIIKCIFNLDADFSIKSDMKHSYNILHVAAIFGSCKDNLASLYTTMQYIVRYHPIALATIPDECDAMGRTPFHHFILRTRHLAGFPVEKQLEILTLLSKNKNPDILNNARHSSKQRPIHEAVCHASAQIVQGVIALGAKLTVPDPSGLHPFQIAIEREDAEKAEMIFNKLSDDEQIALLHSIGPKAIIDAVAMSARRITFSKPLLIALKRAESLQSIHFSSLSYVRYFVQKSLTILHDAITVRNIDLFNYVIEKAGHLSVISSVNIPVALLNMGAAMFDSVDEDNPTSGKDRDIANQYMQMLFTLFDRLSDEVVTQIVQTETATKKLSIIDLASESKHQDLVKLLNKRITAIRDEKQQPLSVKKRLDFLFTSLDKAKERLKTNPALARDYLERAATVFKNDEAKRWLGHCNLLGLGTAKNPKKAFKLYQAAAATDEVSKCFVAACYQLGIGTEKNTAQYENLKQEVGSIYELEFIIEPDQDTFAPSSSPENELSLLIKLILDEFSQEQSEENEFKKGGDDRVPKTERLEKIIEKLRNGKQNLKQPTSNESAAFIKGIKTAPFNTFLRLLNHYVFTAGIFPNKDDFSIIIEKSGEMLPAYAVRFYRLAYEESCIDEKLFSVMIRAADDESLAREVFCQAVGETRANCRGPEIYSAMIEVTRSFNYAKVVFQKAHEEKHTNSTVYYTMLKVAIKKGEAVFVDDIYKLAVEANHVDADLSHLYIDYLIKCKAPISADAYQRCHPVITINEREFDLSKQSYGTTWIFLQKLFDKDKTIQVVFITGKDRNNSVVNAIKDFSRECGADFHSDGHFSYNPIKKEQEEKEHKEVKVEEISEQIHPVLAVQKRAFVADPQYDKLNAVIKKIREDLAKSNPELKILQRADSQALTEKIQLCDDLEQLQDVLFDCVITQQNNLNQFQYAFIIRKLNSFDLSQYALEFFQLAKETQYHNHSPHVYSASIHAASKYQEAKEIYSEVENTELEDPYVCSAIISAAAKGREQDPHAIMKMYDRVCTVGNEHLLHSHVFSTFIKVSRLLYDLNLARAAFNKALSLKLADGECISQMIRTLTEFKKFDEIEEIYKLSEQEVELRDSVRINEAYLDALVEKKAESKLCDEIQKRCKPFARIESGMYEGAIDLAEHTYGNIIVGLRKLILTSKEPITLQLVMGTKPIRYKRDLQAYAKVRNAVIALCRELNVVLINNRRGDLFEIGKITYKPILSVERKREEKTVSKKVHTSIFLPTQPAVIPAPAKMPHFEVDREYKQPSASQIQSAKEKLQALNLFCTTSQADIEMTRQVADKTFDKDKDSGIYLLNGKLPRALQQELLRPLKILGNCNTGLHLLITGDIALHLAENAIRKKFGEHERAFIPTLKIDIYVGTGKTNFADVQTIFEREFKAIFRSHNNVHCIMLDTILGNIQLNIHESDDLVPGLQNFVKYRPFPLDGVSATLNKDGSFAVYVPQEAYPDLIFRNLSEWVNEVSKDKKKAIASFFNFFNLVKYQVEHRFKIKIETLQNVMSILPSLQSGIKEPEIIKLFIQYLEEQFLTGQAEIFYNILSAYDAVKIIFPFTAEIKDDINRQYINDLMRNLDKSHNKNPIKLDTLIAQLLVIATYHDDIANQVTVMTDMIDHNPLLKAILDPIQDKLALESKLRVAIKDVDLARNTVSSQIMPFHRDAPAESKVLPPASDDRDGLVNAHKKAKTALPPKLNLPFFNPKPADNVRVSETKYNSRL